MKIKVTVENVGPHHARLEIEDDCEVNGIRTLLGNINRELPGGYASCVSWISPTMLNGNGGTESPSEDAMRALKAAAHYNGTDVESVCRGYGVNPKNISKQDCWRMTQDLNKRSGYGN